MSQAEHGIKTAYYANYHLVWKPVMECLCGFETDPADSWEQAGEALDEHLRSEGVR